jgi:hypothetical protein
MNIGPVLGVAVATALMAFAGPGAGPAGPAVMSVSATGPALTVLAAVAAAGALLAAALPGRRTATGPPRPGTTP